MRSDRRGRCPILGVCAKSDLADQDYVSDELGGNLVAMQIAGMLYGRGLAISASHTAVVRGVEGIGDSKEE